MLGTTFAMAKHALLRSLAMASFGRKAHDTARDPATSSKNAAQNRWMKRCRDDRIG
jgi:hypothetical protein